MAVDHLDYEQTLAALLDFIGTWVLVYVQDAETEFVGATMIGPLRRGNAADIGASVPELEGDFGGESLVFSVGEPQPNHVFGGFTIWRAGFAWGRRVERPHGYTVVVETAGLRIRVRSAPPLP